MSINKRKVSGVWSESSGPTDLISKSMTYDGHRGEATKHLRFALMHLLAADNLSTAQSIDDLIDQIEGKDFDLKN